MVLQVDIEEILFAESRTIALVDFKAKEISYTCRIHFRPSRSSVFLFLYFELWGQHMAVGPSYTVYTTNVMRITYHKSPPTFGAKYTCVDDCCTIT